MSFIKNLEEDIKKMFKEAGYDVEQINLQVSGRKDLGDYQLNEAFELAKKYHQNPREIANKIVEKLKEDKKFENINIAGPGFINLRISNNYLINIVNKLKNDIYNNIDLEPKRKIVIDYGGANLAKTLHVGHLRSPNLGEALK